MEDQGNFFHNQKTDYLNDFIPEYQIRTIEQDQITVNFIFENNKFVNAFLSLKSDSRYNFQGKGLAIDEEGYTATIELAGPQKLNLFAFASDYLVNKKYYEKFDFENDFYLSGWALSLNHQLNPPEIKRFDGKKITTAGSSIMLPQQSDQLDEYAYQFHVKEVTEFFFLDFINVVKIKTRLALMPGGEIPLELYATERVIPADYFPESGQDIYGIFILSCNL